MRIIIAIVFASLWFACTAHADHGDDLLILPLPIPQLAADTESTHPKSFDVCVSGDPCDYVLVQESNLDAQQKSRGDCAGTLRAYKLGKDSTRTEVQPEWSAVWPNGFSTALPSDSHNFVIFNCIDGIPGMLTFITWQPQE